MLKPKLTYANVAATLALIFSMTGSAIAAHHYLITSTKQISPKVVSALKGKTGPTGPQGIPGKEGSPGKDGAIGKEGKTGPAGATKVTVHVQTETIAAKSSGSAVAVCPAGSVATGGGVNPVGVTAEPALVKSYPSTGSVVQANEGETPTAWGGWVYNPTGSPATLYVQVICASP